MLITKKSFASNCYKWRNIPALALYPNLNRNHCTKREDKTSQKCVIFLHNKAIASASSHNIKEARKQAAIHAIAYLEDNLHIIPDLCDCGIQQLESDAGEEEEEEEEDGQSSIP